MTDIKNDFFGDDAVKRLDLGLGIGVAYEINRPFAGLSSKSGLVKVHDGDGPLKNVNFSARVGYRF